MEIYSTLPKEIIEKVAEEDVEVLWLIFGSLEGDKEFKRIYNYVKNGVNVRFDIRYIVKGYYEEYPISHKVKVRGYGKIKIEVFWDELEERKKLMKEVIMSMYDDDKIKPREN